MRVSHALMAFGLIVVLLGFLTVATGAEVSDEERAVCEAEGGCAFITASWLRAQLGFAYSKGHSEGVKACVKSTT